MTKARMIDMQNIAKQDLMQLIEFRQAVLNLRCLLYTSDAADEL